MWSCYPHTRASAVGITQTAGWAGVVLWSHIRAGVVGAVGAVFRRTSVFRLSVNDSSACRKFGALALELEDISGKKTDTTTVNNAC